MKIAASIWFCREVVGFAVTVVGHRNSTAKQGKH